LRHCAIADLIQHPLGPAPQVVSERVPPPKALTQIDKSTIKQLGAAWMVHIEPGKTNLWMQATSSASARAGWAKSGRRAIRVSVADPPAGHSS
jgi:hypothetical protein